MFPRHPRHQRLKPVRIDRRIYDYIIPRHRRFINDPYLRSLVHNTPRRERIYEMKNHFRIEARRGKRGRKWVRVIVWVHERTDCFWVGKVHTKDLNLLSQKSKIQVSH